MLHFTLLLLEMKKEPPQNCSQCNTDHICCTLHRWLFFAPETGSLDADMNLTQVDSNATITLNYWNTFAKAVGKNVTVVVLGITINYINATMIHTFNKYHVCKVGLLLYFTCQRVIIFCYLYYFFILSWFFCLFPAQVPLVRRLSLSAVQEYHLEMPSTSPSVCYSSCRRSLPHKTLLLI